MIMCVGQDDFAYSITKGNGGGHFEMVRKHGVWALHFRRRLKHPGKFPLEITGRRVDPLPGTSEWEAPLTLHVTILATS